MVDQRDHEPMGILDAFFFSVETQATIGYSAPGNDIFFKDCTLMAALITLQTLSGLVRDLSRPPPTKLLS